MEWIGNIDNKAQAIRDLHHALDAEGQHGFLMRFDTSNVAMRDSDAVADALDTVASLLRSGYTSGPIADVNGNTVGSWEVVIPEDEERPCSDCGDTTYNDDGVWKHGGTDDTNCGA